MADFGIFIVKTLEEIIVEVSNLPYIRDAKVGAEYEVPCVENKGDFLPIIPLAHDDKEIGFNFLHVHYDFRFFSDSDLNRFSKTSYLKNSRRSKNTKFSFVRVLDWQDHHDFVSSRNPNDVVEIKFKIERRICFRDSGVPTDSLCQINQIGNGKNLADRNLNKRCLDSGICPHKFHKFSDSSVKGREGHNKVLHCPLHGLKFQMTTGKLLRCGKAMSPLE